MKNLFKLFKLGWQHTRLPKTHRYFKNKILLSKRNIEISIDNKRHTLFISTNELTSMKFTLDDFEKFYQLQNLVTDEELDLLIDLMGGNDEDNVLTCV